MARNPLEEFGGQPLTAQPVQEAVNPLAEFGGQPVTEAKSNPLVEFGGEPVTATKSRAAELRAEKQKYGFFDLLSPDAAEARGGVMASRSVPKEDVEALAVDNGLTPEQVELVKEIAPLWVAAPPTGEMSAKDAIYTVLGRAGYALADIPQFVAKKTLPALEDPKVRETLDDLKELGEGRMGAAEWAAWNIGPAILTGGGTAVAKTGLGAVKSAITSVPKSIPGLIARGAVTGAAQGLGGSREGQELEAAAAGAALGGTIAPAAAGVGKLFSKMRGEKAAKEAVEGAEEVAAKVPDKDTLTYQQNNEADLTKIGNEAYDSIKKSEDAIEKAIFEKKPVSAAEANAIIDEQMTPETVAIAKKRIAETAGKKVEDVTNIEVADYKVRERFDSWIDEIAERDPALKTKMVTDETGRVLRNYRRAATNDEIYEAIQSRGAQYLRDDFKASKWATVAESAAQQEGIRFRGDDAPVGKLVADTVGDRQFGFKVADERTGADSLKNFYATNTNTNKMTVAKSKFFSEAGGIRDIYSAAKKAKGLVKDLVSDDGVMYKALTTRDLSQLPAEWKGTAEGIIKFFDNVKEFANTVKGDDISPLAIRTREDFGLPQKMVRPTDYLLKMRTKFDTIKDILPSLTPEQLKSAVSGKPVEGLSEVAVKDINEFARGINLVDPRAKVDTLPSLLAAYKNVSTKGGTGVKLHAVASTTMERTEAIPDFLREKNVFRLMDRYTTDTLKNVYLRKPLERLMKTATLLDKTGAKTEAAFIKRYVADQLGMRATSIARLGQEVRMAFTNSVDKALSAVIKDPARRERAVKLIASFPEAMASLQYNIYPNVLGLNIRAHIAQLTQPLFKTAPEMGGAYGYKTVARAYFTTQMNILKQVASRAGQVFGADILPPDVFAKLKAYGLEPKTFTRENVDDVAEGLRIRSGFNRANRAMADFILKTYSSMDSLNRAATLSAAETVTKDFLAGDNGAIKVVARMPLAVRRQVIDAKGNPEAITKAIAVHLNSATQFNYNKASMSELGVIVGPFLSSFTKWPLATAGDIAADLRTKGIGKGSVRVLEKYGAVYALAQAMDTIMYAAVTGDVEVNPDWKEAGPRWAKILGRSGFTGMSPIQSVAPVVGAVFPGAAREPLVKSPIVESFYDNLIKPTMEGDEEKVQAGVRKLGTTFVPGGFMDNLINKTAPAVFNDETEW